MNRRFLLAAAAALPASTVALDTAHAGASGPVAVVDAFHASMKRGDAVAVAALLAEDAVIFEQGGAERSKAEYVSVHLPGDIGYSALTKDEVTGRRSDVAGAMAFVMSEGRTGGEYEGKPVNRRTTETMVLKRGRSGWRIAHIHWSSRAG